MRDSENLILVEVYGLGLAAQFVVLISLRSHQMDCLEGGSDGQG